MDIVSNINQLADKADETHNGARKAFAKVLVDNNYKVGAELGLLFGGFSEMLFKEYGIERIYGVDVFKEGTPSAVPLSQGDWDYVYRRTRDRLSKYDFILLRKRTDEAVFDIEEKLDFVFIDADHSNKAVFYDIAYWYPLVKEGGIIGGHDYGHPNFPGVKKAVDTFFSRIGQTVNTDVDGIWWIKKELKQRIDGVKISVAIPTYNSSNYILDAVNSVIDDSRVSEIVISDDGSEDALKLSSLVSGLPKVRLYLNGDRLGGLWNKERTLVRCHNQRAVLLDSDNYLEKSYIDKLYEIPEWVPNTTYAPDYGGGRIDYRATSSMYVSLENVRGLINSKKMKQMLLDTGNFFVDVPRTIRAINEHKEVTGHVPCSLMINYFLFRMGCRLFIVEGMEYFHRIRKDSYWFEQNESIRNWDDNMHKAILEERKIDL